MDLSGSVLMLAITLWLCLKAAIRKLPAVVSDHDQGRLVGIALARLLGAIFWVHSNRVEQLRVANASGQTSISTLRFVQSIVTKLYKLN